MGWSQKCLKIQEEFVRDTFISFVVVLSEEIMASRLRNHKAINGFQIQIDNKTNSIKISQLAEDTTLFCTST